MSPEAPVVERGVPRRREENRPAREGDGRYRRDDRRLARVPRRAGSGRDAPPDAARDDGGQAARGRGVRPEVGGGPGPLPDAPAAGAAEEGGEESECPRNLPGSPGISRWHRWSFAKGQDSRCHEHYPQSSLSHCWRPQREPAPPTGRPTAATRAERRTRQRRCPAHYSVDGHSPRAMPPHRRGPGETHACPSTPPTIR